MIFIFECTLPVDIFNTILSNEYTANNLVSFYIYSNNHSSHSAKQSYQTILRKRCSPLYIYSGTKIKQDDHRSKYPSIFPGSSILLFSSVPSSHCIIESYRDRQRKKRKNPDFQAQPAFSIGYFHHDGRFIPTSFEPASLGGKIQFFHSPRLFILTLKGVIVQIFIRINLSFTPFIFTGYFRLDSRREQIRSQFRSHLRIYFLASLTVRYLQETRGH